MQIIPGRPKLPASGATGNNESLHPFPAPGSAARKRANDGTMKRNRSKAKWFGGERAAKADADWAAIAEKRPLKPPGRQNGS